MTTTPGDLTTSITNLGTSDEVGEYTDVSISFTVSNEVDSSGFFEFKMAKWNPGTQSLRLVTSAVSYSLADATTTFNAYEIPCTSADHPSITCTFILAIVNDLSEIVSARDTLRVTGLSSNIPIGGTFTFETSDSRFRNPPSTRELETFEGSSHLSTL
jgi:hypothetical protein